jgi:hypothetical protein
MTNSIDSLSDLNLLGDGESSRALDSSSSCQDESSKSGSSPAVNSGGYSSTDSVKEALTKEETKQVFRLRLLVIFIFLAAGTSISLTVYFITKNAQIERFEIQYAGVADKIIEQFQEIMVQMSAVSGLAVAATTDAEEQKKLLVLSQDSAIIGRANWPFVTMPRFQERAGNVRALSGAIHVSINPIVHPDQVAEWEAYAHGEANMWM